MSFCVGLELYNADTAKKIYMAYVVVFGLMSSLGIAIGIALTTAFEENTCSYLVTVGVLQVEKEILFNVIIINLVSEEKWSDETNNIPK